MAQQSPLEFVEFAIRGREHVCLLTFRELESTLVRYARLRIASQPTKARFLLGMPSVLNATRLARVRQQQVRFCLPSGQETLHRRWRCR